MRLTAGLQFRLVSPCSLWPGVRSLETCGRLRAVAGRPEHSVCLMRSSAACGRHPARESLEAARRKVSQRVCAVAPVAWLPGRQQAAELHMGRGRPPGGFCWPTSFSYFTVRVLIDMFHVVAFVRHCGEFVVLWCNIEVLALFSAQRRRHLFAVVCAGATWVCCLWRAFCYYATTEVIISAHCFTTIRGECGPVF